MARCRCDPDTCGCNLIAGSGIFLTGSGDQTSPWVISASNCVQCATPGNPGDVLTRQPDGTYAPQPPAQVADSCVDCAAAANPSDVLMWSTTASLYQPQPVPTGAQGPPGAPGPAGPQGEPGQSVQIVGQVPTSTALTSVSNPEEGDGWMTADTGHLWVFTGPAPNDNISKWTDVGLIRGPAGPEGDRGSLWYSAAGVPGVITGVLPNDQYLDTSTGDVYMWAA